MKKLLTIFFLWSLAYGQTTPLTFTPIASSPDLITPDRGAEGWNGRVWDNGVGGGIKIPAGNVTRYNDYYRFLWRTDIAESPEGTYNFTTFDAQINKAIDSNRLFSFGIMPMCDACGVNPSYPDYLHTLMQAEATNSKDWQNSNGDWVPNWNSPNYLARYKALLVAVAAHIATGTHGGKNYRDVIGYVDVRGYGDFGEWQTFPWTGTEPTGRTATAASLDSLVDFNRQAFPNWPNVNLQGVFDPSNSSRMPQAVTTFALAEKNNLGLFGWRRDQWGDPGDSVILDKNPNGHPITDSIINRYKQAPIVGEPQLTSSTYNCGSIMCDLPREMTFYHGNSFGDGNFSNTGDAGTQANVIQASRNSGYRIAPTGGSMTTAISAGASFALTVNWQNTGVAPPYWNWNVVYQLRTSGGATVVSWTSTFNPRLFLPSGSAASFTDNFVVPISVSPGVNYSVYVVFQDPGAYKKPLSLAITGRGSDGAYLVRSGITVSSGNPKFNVNAGPDQTLVSTATSTSLAGIIPTDSVTLIMFMGESNSAGLANNAPATPLELSSRPEVQIYNHNTKVFENLKIGAGGNNQQGTFADTPNVEHGMELDLANLVDTGLFAGNIVYLCKIGISGGVICQWLPGGCIKVGDTQNFDAWDGYMPFMDSAVAKLTRAGKKFRIIVWGSIGLNDRFNQGTTPATFMANMATFRQNVRSRYGRNDIKFLYTNFNNPPGPNLPAGEGLSYDWSTYFFQMAAADSTFHSIPVTNATYKDGSTHYDYYGFKTIDHNMIDTMLFAPSIQSGIGGTYTVSWSKISGPSNVTFTAPTSKNTNVTGLIIGSYVFQMAVTDSVGTVQTDNVTVVVGSIMPTGPTAIISGPSSITSPTSSISLDGTGSTDPGGTITTYAWTNVSGPNTPTITTASASTTTVTGMIVGSYVFQLQVTDNNSLSNSTTITVVVNPAIPPDQPPVAVITGSGSIQFPVTSVSLSGTSSFDPDGTVVAYAWSNVSGPNTPTIVSATASATNITGMIVGTYVFELVVTDNGGDTGSTFKTVIVNRSPTGFIIGSGAGSVILNTMAGHLPGDTAYIATQTGVYTNLVLQNLNGILVRPQSGRPVFTTQSTFCNWIGVSIAGISFVSAGNATAVDATCGRIDSSQIMNLYFEGWSGPVWNAGTAYGYTYGVDSTYRWLRDRFDSLKYYHCGTPYQVAFGLSPITNNICRRDTFRYNIIEATTSTSGEGIMYSGVCYGCLGEFNKYTAITGRGPSGDDGMFNGTGWWVIRNNYQSGSPARLTRIFPMMELNDTGTTLAYNNIRVNCQAYGMFCMEANLGDTIAGKLRCNGGIFYNNTLGNQFNDTLNLGSYWSPEFDLGQVAPNMHYYVSNNFAFNVGNNPQKVQFGGQPNNGKPQMCVNLGGWNTIGQDTSHNKYWSYATVALLDSTHALFMNSLGGFAGYYLGVNSPGLIQTGLTNPLTSTDYLGNPYRVPPDLGYVQYFFIPNSKPFIPSLHNGFKKRFFKIGN